MYGEICIPFRVTNLKELHNYNSKSKRAFALTFFYIKFIRVNRQCFWLYDD